MNVIYRINDCITYKNDLELLKTFNRFPVFMGCVTHEPAQDQYVDMNFYISTTSGLIQLNPILPLEVVYQTSHGSGTVGTAWQLHHQSFSDFIGEHSPNSVFEIGGGTGVLSAYYKNSHRDIEWTILEPNPDPVVNCTAKYVTGFFDDTFMLTTEFDAIVHSHIIEHVFNPSKFLSDLSKFASVGKKMFFSVPNLKEMFKRNYTNCINFEHTLLLTEEYIDHLLAVHKFRILKKHLFSQDHSIFYAVERTENSMAHELPIGLYDHNKKMFMEYIKYFDVLIARFNSELDKQSDNVYLFGAHIFSQFLINRGLNTSKIVSILDNDVNKQGKRLYGSSLTVESPTVLKDKLNPCVILKVANYSDEIKKEIIENINADVRFLE